jgi:hypothetical protein
MHGPSTGQGSLGFSKRGMPLCLVLLCMVIKRPSSRCLGQIYLPSRWKCLLLFQQKILFLLQFQLLLCLLRLWLLLLLILRAISGRARQVLCRSVMEALGRHQMANAGLEMQVIGELLKRGSAMRSGCDLTRLGEVVKYQGFHFVHVALIMHTGREYINCSRKKLTQLIIKTKIQIKF